jgi:hypothetical protein
LIFKFCKKLKQISITNSATFDQRFFYSIIPCFAKNLILIIVKKKFNDECLDSLSLTVQNLNELVLSYVLKVALKNFNEFCENGKFKKINNNFNFFKCQFQNIAKI